jgi:hypothetical protein
MATLTEARLKLSSAPNRGVGLFSEPPTSKNRGRAISHAF